MERHHSQYIREDGACSITRSSATSFLWRVLWGLRLRHGTSSAPGNGKKGPPDLRSRLGTRRGGEKGVHRSRAGRKGGRDRKYYSWCVIYSRRVRVRC